jgi:hypothetical protein
MRHQRAFARSAQIAFQTIECSLDRGDEGNMAKKAKKAKKKKSAKKKKK